MDRILSQVLRESDFLVESLARSSDSAGEFRLAASEHPSGYAPVLFAICTTPGVHNYCLVVFVDSISNSFVSEDIPSYFTALRNYLNERFVPAMPKNFSLIVCWRRKSVSHDGTEPLILQIEEDPFDFKKYVLVYNQSEVDALYEEWQQSQSSMLSFLNNYLYQDGNFALFKNQTAPLAYNLATRLFIKIPFLRVPVNERPFEDLQAVIRNKLGEQLASLRDELLNTTPDEFMNSLQETEKD